MSFNNLPTPVSPGVSELTDAFWNAQVYDLSNGLQVSWTAWVPSLTNVTLGNGVVTGWYRRIGHTCDVHITFTFGSTSSISGAITSTLPFAVAARYVAGVSTLGGPATAMDVSSNTNYLMAIVISSVGSSLVQFAPNAANRAAATVPMTWATGDVLDVEFRVELA